MLRRIRSVNRLVQNYRTGRFAKSMRYPRYVFLEVTNRCNLSCRQCNRTVMTRPVGNMSLSLFHRIVDEVAPHVDILDLNMWGEPLFHPDILHMIDYAKSKGVREVMLNTNCHAMDSKLAKGLIHSKLDLLTFSIDAATAATYREIRVNGDFERVVTNIENYLALKKRGNVRGPKTIAQMILMKRNQNEKNAFYRRWTGKTDLVYIRPLASMGDLKGTYHAEKVHEITGRRTVCSNPWKAMFIYWDGKVVFCGDDVNASLPMGDLNHASVLDVWTGESWHQMRGRMKTGNYPHMCQNCAEWAMSKPLRLTQGVIMEVLPRSLMRFIRDLHILSSNGKIQ